jgi:hypothetical protein
MKNKIIKAILPFLIVFSAASNAALIEYNFTLTVDNVNDANGITGFNIGDVISGSFSYDDTALNRGDRSSNADSYLIDLTAGSIAFVNNSFGPSMDFIDLTPDLFVLRAQTEIISPLQTTTGNFRMDVRGDLGYTSSALGFGFRTPVYDVPIDDPSAAYTWRYETYDNDYFDYLYRVEGTWSFGSADSTSVSAPASAGLMAAGLFGLVLLRRKNQLVKAK